MSTTTVCASACVHAATRALGARSRTAVATCHVRTEALASTTMAYARVNVRAATEALVARPSTAVARIIRVKTAVCAQASTDNVSARVRRDIAALIARKWTVATSCRVETEAAVCRVEMFARARVPPDTEVLSANCHRAHR